MLCKQFKQFLIETSEPIIGTDDTLVHLKFRAQEGWSVEEYIDFFIYYKEHPKCLVHIINDQSIAYTTEAIKRSFDNIDQDLGRMIGIELKTSAQEHLAILQDFHNLGYRDVCGELLLHRPNYAENDVLPKQILDLMKTYHLPTFSEDYYQCTGANAVSNPPLEMDF